LFLPFQCGHALPKVLLSRLPFPLSFFSSQLYFYDSPVENSALFLFCLLLSNSADCPSSSPFCEPGIPTSNLPPLALERDCANQVLSSFFGTHDLIFFCFHLLQPMFLAPALDTLLSFFSSDKPGWPLVITDVRCLDAEGPSPPPFFFLLNFNRPFGIPSPGSPPHFLHATKKIRFLLLLFRRRPWFLLPNCIPFLMVFPTKTYSPFFVDHPTSHRYIDHTLF